MSKMLFSFFYMCLFAVAGTLIVGVGGALSFTHWLSIIIIKSFSWLPKVKELHFE